MTVQKRTFYRILPTPTPTELDFTSFHELGRMPSRMLSAEAEELWRGVSVFDRLGNAQAHVGRSAHLGSYAAVLEVGPEHRMIARRTGSTRGHWTIWGRADEMLACVTGIIDLRTEQEDE